MIDTIKKNADRMMKWATLLFLFLFSLHLFNFPDTWIILWCLFSIGVFWVQNRKLCLDKTFWVLAFAVILNGLGTKYYLGESLGYTWKDIIKMVVPTLLIYPYMKQAAYEKEDKDIEKIILAIVLGTFAYSLLNYYSLVVNGFYQGDYRGWSDFWTNYNWRATHHSYWGCFIAGVSGYGLYCCFAEKKWLKGILILAAIAVENYIQIAGDNRMVLCVTVVALAVSVLLFCVFNMKNPKRVRNVLVIAAVCAVIIAAVIITNTFGIQDTGYYQRFVTRNGGILRNDRFQMIYEAIRMLPSHWKGGATMYAAGNFWVHNYWLQVANVSGILPFAFWMVVNAAMLLNVLKIIKSTVISNKVKYLLIPMLASILGYLMMEPAGTELNRYIIFYVIIIALLKQLANRKCGVKNVSISSETGCF